MYESERVIAESSNNDYESHGQGASIATNPRKLLTNSGCFTFINSYPPANTTEVLWNSAALWRTNWTYSVSMSSLSALVSITHHSSLQCYNSQEDDSAAVEALLARKNCYQ